MKRVWDQISEKCSRCNTPTYSGAGNQFVDEDSDLQRYCPKCWKKYCDELERRYDAAAAKSARPPEPDRPPEPAQPAEKPAESVGELPPPPPDVVGPQGDGAPPSVPVQ